MKKLILPSLALVSILVFSASCSTCYECSESVVITDNNGNPIDTTTNNDEFCTSDKDEVTSREDDGAVCQVQ